MNSVGRQVGHSIASWSIEVRRPQSGILWGCQESSGNAPNIACGATLEARQMRTIGRCLIIQQFSCVFYSLSPLLHRCRDCYKLTDI